MVLGHACHRPASRFRPPSLAPTRNDLRRWWGSVAGFSPSTRGHLLGMVRAFYAEAVERTWVVADPSKGIRAPHRENDDETPALTREEALRLIASIRAECDHPERGIIARRDLAIVAVMLRMCLRCNEVHWLRWRALQTLDGRRVLKFLGKFRKWGDPVRATRRRRDTRRVAGKLSRTGRRGLPWAASRLNVTTQIRSAGTPRASRTAILATMVVVLPLPAGAMICAGPSGSVAAWRCSSSSAPRMVSSAAAVAAAVSIRRIVRGSAYRGLIARLPRSVSHPTGTDAGEAVSFRLANEDRARAAS